MACRFPWAGSPRRSVRGVPDAATQSQDLARGIDRLPYSFRSSGGSSSGKTTRALRSHRAVTGKAAVGVRRDTIPWLRRAHAASITRMLASPRDRIAPACSVEVAAELVGCIRAGVELDRHSARRAQEEARSAIIVEDLGFGIETISGQLVAYRRCRGGTRRNRRSASASARCARCLRRSGVDAGEVALPVNG